MIRIQIVRDDHYEAGLTIVTSGHANPVVCAGVSAILQTTMAGLFAIESSYPAHVKINALRIRRPQRKKRRRK